LKYTLKEFWSAKVHSGVNVREQGVVTGLTTETPGHDKHVNVMWVRVGCHGKCRQASLAIDSSRDVDRKVAFADFAVIPLTESKQRRHQKTGCCPFCERLLDISDYEENGEEWEKKQKQRMIRPVAIVLSR
jgi:hypothetical protein